MDALQEVTPHPLHPHSLTCICALEHGLIYHAPRCPKPYTLMLISTLEYRLMGSSMP